MILPVLWSVEPFWRFRFGQVFEARLGYLAIDMESYSRNLQFESIPPRTTHVFFAYNPANRQLLKIWKRHYFIVENRLARWMSFTFLPVMENTRFYLRFPTSAQAADVLSHGHSVWFYPDSPDTSLRVDNPHLEVKNAKKTIYSRI